MKISFPYINLAGRAGLLTLLLGISLSGAAQPSRVDSLRRQQHLQLEQGEQTALMHTLYALGEAYLNLQEPDSAYFAFERALAYAGTLEEPLLRFRCLLQLGQLDRYPRQDVPKSIQRLKMAEAILGAPIDPELGMPLYWELGHSYLMVSDYDAAMNYQMRSFEMAEAANDSSHMATSLLALGGIYWHIEQYDNALTRYRRAYTIARNIGLPTFSHVSSIGLAHYSLAHLDSAFLYTRLARKEAAQSQYEYGQAYSLGLMGNILLKQGNPAAAIDSLHKAVAWHQALGSWRDASSFRTDLARAYMAAERYAAALRQLDTVQMSLTPEESATLRMDAYQVRAEAYALMGDTSQAFRYQQRHYRLKDSLMNEEVLASLMQIEREHELGKKDATILTQQEKLDQSRRFLYLYGFGSGILFLLVVLYMAYTRNRSLREANRKLAEKNGEIQRQNERLASSNEDLRQFAHVTSHDLREPLRNISSFATLLIRRYQERLDQPGKEYLDVIIRGVKRMDQLLSDLLTYSVVGVFEHEYAEVDLGKRIGDIIRRLHQEGRSQGAKISLHDLPTIRANPAQMDQLFAQLLDNAIKFRSERKPEIDISARPEGEGYVFAVKDNGIGMDRAYKDKIFALFLRLNDQAERYEGSGIGLSIVKKIVEQHEGRIWIESEPGKGTTVYFSLPKQPAASGKPPRVRSQLQWLEEGLLKETAPAAARQSREPEETAG